LENPAWHIHSGKVPEVQVPVSFSMLLNLASACNPEDASVLWGFLSRYASNITPDSAPMLDRLAKHAVRYYHDFIKPAKRYRAPTEAEIPAFIELRDFLAGLNADTPADDIQNIIFEIGKRHADAFPDLKDWFAALYQVLLGQDTGPRMGSFVALYGVQETLTLIKRVLAGENLGQAA
jgi:lysyl-tRNA synthetase class 1